MSPPGTALPRVVASGAADAAANHGRTHHQNEMGALPPGLYTGNAALPTTARRRLSLRVSWIFTLTGFWVASGGRSVRAASGLVRQDQPSSLTYRANSPRSTTINFNTSIACLSSISLSSDFTVYSRSLDIFRIIMCSSNRRWRGHQSWANRVGPFSTAVRAAACCRPLSPWLVSFFAFIIYLGLHSLYYSD